MNLSIVIPVYNRADIICKAIDSALEFYKDQWFKELIVVDDGSTDAIESVIADKYPALIALGQLKLFRLQKNMGVTAARNRGLELATGDWVLFLDSDDELFSESQSGLLDVLSSLNKNHPIVFFRCADHNGKLVGPTVLTAYPLTLAALLRDGTPGECLGVVRKDLIVGKLYDEDLRGFESVGYCRLLKNGATAWISTVIARKYKTERTDRLSTKAGVAARGCLLSRGYLRLLVGYWRVVGLLGSLNLLARATFHAMNCLSHYCRSPRASGTGQTSRDA